MIFLVDRIYLFNNIVLYLLKIVITIS